jgi:hypothetical protein
MIHRVLQRGQRWRANRQLAGQVRRVETYLSQEPVDSAADKPVLVFNASTRIHSLSLNGAFSLLAAWGLRARGVPVWHLVCQQGMEQCILGTDQRDLDRPPPCGSCLAFSRLLFPPERTRWLTLDQQAAASAGFELDGRSLDELRAWTYEGFPLGELCWPGLCWALRRNDLPDDEPERRLYRQYLRSAASLVEQIGAILDELQPQALIVFNGITYPEAVARELARRRQIPVVTHEVGLRPYSAFFSHEEATFRQIDLTDGHQLDPAQQAQLDAYLQSRRAGRFSMAGVRFWPVVEGLPADLEDRLETFERAVTVFTNVIFDTSQVHANSLFDDMFDWLEALVPVVQSHPDTLFIFRAHPDEDRPGKVSRQAASDWFAASDLHSVENAVLIRPDHYASSYELIERSNLVLIYNSSVGLEASIMGAPVLSAGRARFTQANTVFTPSSRAEYSAMLEALLAAGEPEPAHVGNARRFLYKELFQASLDFSRFLRPYPQMPGMVLFEEFDPAELQQSLELGAVAKGVVAGTSFMLPAPLNDQAHP